MDKIKKTIQEKVYQTPFIDTHEHLCEESEMILFPQGLVKVNLKEPGYRKLPYQKNGELFHRIGIM